MAGTNSKILLFNAGESLDLNDLNNIGYGLSQRSWEWPDYANALNVAPIHATAYATLWGTPPVDKCVFTKGAGCIPKRVSNTESSLEPGFIGLWTSTAPPTVIVPASAPAAPAMRWIYVNAAQVTFTHTLNTDPTNNRWDIVTVKIDQVDGDASSRNFKDAATGVVTTTTPNKTRQLQATFTVTAGTPAATPTIPAVPAGERILFAVKNLAASAGLAAFFFNGSDSCRDFTIPWGPSMGYNTVPFRDMHTTTWVADGTSLKWAIKNTTNGVVLLPAPINDPTARLIGIHMRAKLTSGASIRLGWIETQVDAIGSALGNQQDISALFTIDSTDRDIFMDLRGQPFTGTDLTGPYWGSGNSVKQSKLPTGFGGGSGGGQHLVMQVFPQGGTSGAEKIYSVVWYFAKA